jgi:hypothetical protein
MKTSILFIGIFIILLAGIISTGYGKDEDRDRNFTINLTNFNKTIIREVRNITFVPWQKINESECMEGCQCHGAVVSCPTATERIINITAGNSGNVITIIVNKTEVNTTLTIEGRRERNITIEKNVTIIEVKLSNGKNAEIKVMPDAASQIALARLRLKVCNITNNCTIELKEVGHGNQTKAVYDVQADAQYRILFLFKTKAKIWTYVDTETGQIIVVKHPWWAFLAKEE